MASASRVKAGEAFVVIETLDKTGYVLTRISKRMSNWSKQMTDMGRKAVIGATLAALPFVFSSKTFADFDDKMREVAAVSEADATGFERLSKKARELGRTTSFTAVQVAGLMVELGKAGFKPEAIEQATEAVLNLARASGTDATLASGIMATTLQQFGLGAEQAARVADNLTMAANKTFNSVEQLGEALSYAGPVAADFNMSLESTLAVLGALGNVGILGSSAGTAVRRLLTLSGAEAEKLKGIFGVEFQDAHKNARPLVDVLGEINHATKDLGSAARSAKFNEAFGLLGITAASALGKVSVSVKELESDLMGAAGTAARTAAAMDKGAGGMMRRFMSAIEGVMIAVGDALEPILIGLGKRVAEVITRFAAWIERNQDTVSGIAVLVIAVGTLGVGLVSLGLALKVASIGLGTLGIAATTVNATILASVAVVKALATAVKVTTTAIVLKGVVLGTYRAAMLAASAATLAFRGALLISAGGMLVANAAAIAGRVAMLGLVAAGNLAIAVMFAYSRAMWALSFGIYMWAATRTAVAAAGTSLVVYRGTVATVRAAVISTNVAFAAMRATMVATSVTAGILATAFDVLRAFVLATIVAVRTFGVMAGLMMAAKFAIAGVATAVSAGMAAVMGAISIGGVLMSVASGVATLFSALAAGVVTILPFVIAIAGLAAGLAAVAAVAWAVWPVLVTLLGTVKQLGSTAFAALGQAASDVGAILSESLLPAISKLIKIVPMAWSGISAALAGGDLQRAVQLAVLGIKSALLTINDVLIQIVAVGKKLWVDLSTAFKVAMIGATAAVQKRLFEVFTGLVDMITQLPGGEWLAEKLLGAGYKDWTAALKLAPDALDTKAGKDTTAAEADGAAQKKIIDAQAKADQATNEKDRRAAEEELRAATNQAKLIRQLQTLTPFGWLGGGGRAAKNSQPGGGTPTSPLTTPKKPLEALQGLEKGTLEAAKAFIEAQDPQTELLKVAQKQAGTLDQIATNTSTPPVTVEVVG